MVCGYATDNDVATHALPILALANDGNAQQQF